MRDTSASQPIASPSIEVVTRFHRFYGHRMRVLDERSAGDRFSDAEARVILALGRSAPTTATSLGKELGIDAGYLSRIVTRLHAAGLVEKTKSQEDGRSKLLTLTAEGERVRVTLDEAARTAVAELLDGLAAADRERLVAAMETIMTVLEGGTRGAPSCLLRPPQPGDMGWVVQQHGKLYAEEYGWEERFEGLAAEVVGGFVRHLDRRRERCWIAERNGESVGSVFCVRESDEVARLRMLQVAPEARGLGIGRRLAEECVRFARGVGYRRMTLSTYDVLRDARRIYHDLGFRLTHEEPHSSFGKEMVEETWELELQGPVQSARSDSTGSTRVARAAGR